MKILIVEDEKISQKKMEIILSKYGCCYAIANGAIALSMFQKAWNERSPFDIITLDITLHEMPGTEVLLKIREIEDELKIPSPLRAKIIMVTSHTDRDNINAAITAGANDYLVKPFSEATIVKCLKKLYIKHIQEAFPEQP
ncbi:MAG: response regulator [Proteobacteria bacterium]|nr:response regulator [Desulfobulbaceae bacterium]MBU4154186.1 response regulator [Pseudomonadota bacterium]MDP2106711.1 response regulator [Desulfobulbaceae bacterium]